MQLLTRDLWPKTIHDTWMQREGKSGWVSVIVPTFNRAKFVLEAIDSVWNQSHRPIELIIIDDGSTDGTEESVREWIRLHNEDCLFQTRYIRQKNLGAAAARNHGLIESTGEYIQFLDSDDLLHSDRLANYIEIFDSSKQLELVHGSFYLDYCAEGNSKIEIGGPASFGENPQAIHYIWTAAGLFKRSVIFESGPWDERLNAHDDVEYFTRVLGVVDSAHVVQKPSVTKRKHGGHRLVDIRYNHEGLLDRQRAFIARERVLEYFGYRESRLVGAWLTLACDFLTLGSKKETRAVLKHCELMCREKFHWLAQWLILYAFSFLPIYLGESVGCVYRVIYSHMRRFRRGFGAKS